MRILGMTELWPKLAKDTFTTFRFTRKDRDWTVGETVQIVYKPRSPKATVRAILGQAEIVKIERRWVIDPLFIIPTEPVRQHPEWDNIPFVTEAEAIVDGFESREAMVRWITNANDIARNYLEPMNKLRLRWRQVWLWVEEQAPDTRRKWAEMNHTIGDKDSIVIGDLAPIYNPDPPVLTSGDSFLRSY